MEHDLELFSPILEILEIGVCNIIYNPGNIGKRIFSLSPILEIVDRTIQYFSPILEIVDRTIHISVLSWKYWIVRSISISPMLMSRGVAGGVAGGRGGSRGFAGGRGRRSHRGVRGAEPPGGRAGSYPYSFLQINP